MVVLFTACSTHSESEEALSARGCSQLRAYKRGELGQRVTGPEGGLPQLRLQEPPPPENIIFKTAELLF